MSAGELTTTGKPWNSITRKKEIQNLTQKQSQRRNQRRIMQHAYVKKLYFPIVIPHTGVFPYLAVYDQLSGLSITPEELNLTL